MAENKKLTYDKQLNNIKKAQIQRILNLYNNEEKGGEIVTSFLEAYKDYLVNTSNKNFLSKLKEELKDIKKFLKNMGDHIYDMEYSIPQKLIEKKRKYIVENTPLYTILSNLIDLDCKISYVGVFYSNAITRIFNISVKKFLSEESWFLDRYNCDNVEEVYGFLEKNLSKINEFKKDLDLKLAQKEAEKDLSLNKATTEVLKIIGKEQEKRKTDKTVIDKTIQDKLLQKD